MLRDLLTFIGQLDVFDEWTLLSSLVLIGLGLYCLFGDEESEVIGPLVVIVIGYVLLILGFMHVTGIKT